MNTINSTPLDFDTITKVNRALTIINREKTVQHEGEQHLLESLPMFVTRNAEDATPSDFGESSYIQIEIEDVFMIRVVINWNTAEIFFC